MIHLVTKQSGFGGNYNIASLSDCMDYVRSVDQVGVDTETEGFSSFTKKVLTLQFGDEHHQFVIDCSTIPLSSAVKIFNLDRRFIYHNGKFDVRFFMDYNVKRHRVYDTFLAELLLHAGYASDSISYSLEDLALRYCGVQLDKATRGVIHKLGLVDRVIRYAAEDVEYLPIIRSKQLPKLYEYEYIGDLEGSDDYDISKLVGLENRVLWVFADMEHRGVCVDKGRWIATSKKAEAELDKVIAKLDDVVLGDSSLGRYVKALQYDLFGQSERRVTVNWSSNDQKKAILNYLGLKVLDVKEATLKKNRANHKIVPLLLDYAKYNKLVDSFGKAYIEKHLHSDGRIRFSIFPILTTGRISVSDPNLNQIPRKGDLGKEIRSCFVARPGYKIVGGDYQGMELAIMAQFSQDPLWIRTLNEGKNLHSVLCSETFEISIEQVNDPFPVKPDITYRDVQKIVDFGLAYGMTEHKLSGELSVGKKQALTIIESFFSKVPVLRKFLHSLGRFASINGYARTAVPYKRRRFFPDFRSAGSFQIGSIERAGKNLPIQGTNADVIKLALVMADDYIQQHGLDARIILSVYDEIQTEVIQREADMWKGELQRIMVEAASYTIKDVPIIVDVKIADCWSK